MTTRSRAFAARGETGLVTYVTAGDPDLRAVGSSCCGRSIGRAPTSSRWACRSPIRSRTGRSSSAPPARARAAGGTLASTLDLVARVRGDIAAPIVLFSYVNPLLAMGERRFAERAAAAGVDGVLVLDLPIEEAATFQDDARPRRAST